MNLQRRLALLEKQILREPTLLTMPDGSTVSIPGRSDYLVRLFVAVIGGETAGPDEARHLDLIRSCTASYEPGGGRLIEVIRCALVGPVKKDRPKLADLTESNSGQTVFLQTELARLSVSTYVRRVGVQ
jgi:hypothetical protein